MLYQALDYVKTTAQWTVGVNNFSAIKDVFHNDYTYNTGHDHSTTKLKQFGTEILHAGLKHATLGILADKSLTHLNLFNIAEPGTLRHSAHVVSDAGQKLISDLFTQVSDYALQGSLSLVCLYGTQDIAKKTWNGLKLLTQTNSETSLKTLSSSVLEVATICIANPLFKGYNAYGLAGATGVMAVYLITQKSNNSMLSSALTIASAVPTLFYIKSLVY